MLELNPRSPACTAITKEIYGNCICTRAKIGNESLKIRYFFVPGTFISCFRILLPEFRLHPGCAIKNGDAKALTEQIYPESIKVPPGERRLCKNQNLTYRHRTLRNLNLSAVLDRISLVSAL
jgi:hypothetical protein